MCIRASVSPRLEMTEVCDRVLRAGGPALPLGPLGLAAQSLFVAERS